MLIKINSAGVVFGMTICMLIASCVWAEDPPDREEGRGYFMIGGSLLNVDDLNASLSENGYSELSDSYLSLGGGGHGIVRGKIVVGGEGHALLGRTKTSSVGDQQYDTKLSGGYGLFNIGYVLFKKGGLNVYPLLGIGGGGVELKIAQSSVGSFEDVLSDPNRGSELSTGGLLLDFALGADHLFILGSDDKEEGGILIGLRCGYTLAPFTRDWNLSGDNLSGGPDFGISGPYFRLAIGGGGSSISEKPKQEIR